MPLHRAVRGRMDVDREDFHRIEQPEIVLLLIRNGANVNAKDDKGRTPLHIAVGEGHMETVRALVSAGADLTARDKRRETSLHAAAKGKITDYVVGKTFEQDRIIVEALPGITRFLVESGADIHAKASFGDAPLHLAASNGHTEVVQLLISLGAKVDAKGQLSRTPLDKAELGGHSSTARALIQAGAKGKRARDVEGQARGCIIVGAGVLLVVIFATAIALLSL